MKLDDRPKRALELIELCLKYSPLWRDAQALAAELRRG